MLDNYIAEVVVSKKELEETIERLGKTLTAEYQDKKSISDLYFKGSYFLYGRPCSCDGLRFRSGFYGCI